MVHWARAWATSPRPRSNNNESRESCQDRLRQDNIRREDLRREDSPTFTTHSILFDVYDTGRLSIVAHVNVELSLLRRDRVVALGGGHAVTVVSRLNLDLAEASIPVCVVGIISEAVLMVQSGTVGGRDPQRAPLLRLMA